MICAEETNRPGATNRLPEYIKFARGRFVMNLASNNVDPVDDACSSWQSINQQPSRLGRTEHGLTSFQSAQQQSARSIRHCLVVASSVAEGGVS